MKILFRLSALLSLFALGPLAQAQLAASNVRPAQRAGSKLGDIDYDVTGTTGLSGKRFSWRDTISQS